MTKKQSGQEVRIPTKSYVNALSLEERRTPTSVNHARSPSSLGLWRSGTSPGQGRRTDHSIILSPIWAGQAQQLRGQLEFTRVRSVQQSRARVPKSQQGENFSPMFFRFQLHQTVPSASLAHPSSDDHLRSDPEATYRLFHTILERRARQASSFT